MLRDQAAVRQLTARKQSESGQAPDTNSSSLDNMFRVAAAVQQIMTELSGAVSEELKIVTVLNVYKTYES
jgi:hypothetical protein